MNRTIKIKDESWKYNKEFEIPERKVKHTRYVLQQTADEKNEDKRAYDIAYHSAYIVLKDLFPKLEYEDIDNLSDEKLTEISNMFWGVKDTANFRKTPKDKKQQ